MASAATALQPPANTESWRSSARPRGLSKLFTPGDRRAERLVPFWQTWIASRQDAQWTGESLQERRGGEHLEAHGGKLERERKSLDESTDPGDISGVGLRQREVGIGHPAPAAPAT